MILGPLGDVLWGYLRALSGVLGRSSSEINETWVNTRYLLVLLSGAPLGKVLWPVGGRGSPWERLEDLWGVLGRHEEALEQIDYVI